MVKVTLDELTQKINANTENITRIELLNEEMNHKWEIIVGQIQASNEKHNQHNERWNELQRQIDRISAENNWLMKKIDAKT